MVQKSRQYDKAWGFGVWYACELLVTHCHREDLASTILIESQLDEDQLREIFKEVGCYEDEMSALLAEVFKKENCDFCKKEFLRRELNIITGKDGECGKLACYECRLQKENEVS